MEHNIITPLIQSTICTPATVGMVTVEDTAITVALTTKRTLTVRQLHLYLKEGNLENVALLAPAIPVIIYTALVSLAVSRPVNELIDYIIRESGPPEEILSGLAFANEVVDICNNPIDKKMAIEICQKSAVLTDRYGSGVIDKGINKVKRTRLITKERANQCIDNIVEGLKVSKKFDGETDEKYKEICTIKASEGELKFDVPLPPTEEEDIPSFDDDDPIVIPRVPPVITDDPPPTPPGTAIV